MKDEEAFRRADVLFKESFQKDPEQHFISYGRLEILGNHTDHQHGHCLVAGCSLGIKGAVRKSADGLVSVASEGYGRFAFPAKDLGVKENEKFHSIALARGVLAGLVKQGYKVGGFQAAINSDIFAGAGVSSSAAYELFVAEVENVLYNGGAIDRLSLAKIGQYSENVFFGKASGLLDQCGSSFGGVQFLDFSDFQNVKVSSLPFPHWDLHIVLVNPGASHAGLSDLYSEMPNDMKFVARTLFGKEVLEEVSPREFYSKIFLPNPAIKERQKLRALHFFEEDSRVLRGKIAFAEGNEMAFLELERATELSQMALLHNVMVPEQYQGSPLEAVNRANETLVRGSARVMGGGLVGSIICFVPSEEYPSFLSSMRGYYGEEAVVEVEIPFQGAHEVK